VTIAPNIAPATPTSIAEATLIACFDGTSQRTRSAITIPILPNKSQIIVASWVLHYRIRASSKSMARTRAIDPSATFTPYFKSEAGRKGVRADVKTA